MFGEESIYGQSIIHLDDKRRIILPKYTYAEKGDKLVIVRKKGYLSVEREDILDGKIKELERPLEITDVSTCPTNHINNETTIVIISGALYTKVALSDATPLATFGLHKKARNADANKTRAKAWRYVTNKPRLITCVIK